MVATNGFDSPEDEPSPFDVTHAISHSSVHSIGQMSSQLGATSHQTSSWLISIMILSEVVTLDGMGLGESGAPERSELLAATVLQSKMAAVFVGLSEGLNDKQTSV